jgi:hypothetical protein
VLRVLLLLAVLVSRSCSPSATTTQHRVTVIGSGNFGSAVARLIAMNVKRHQDVFEDQVRMWVFEEEVSPTVLSRHHCQPAHDTLQTSANTVCVFRWPFGRIDSPR